MLSMCFMNKNTKLCFYDIESSGLDVFTESILEICFKDFETRETILHIYVKPSNGKKITNANIHKIDEKVLEEKNALTIQDALKTINRTLKDKYGTKQIVLGAHNNFGFDQILLESEYQRAGIKPLKNILFFDTYPFIKHYFQNLTSYKLMNCYKSIMGHSVEEGDKLHTAEYDTEIMTDLVHRIFTILLKEHKLKVKLDDFVRFSHFDKRYLLQNANMMTGVRKSMSLERKGIKRIKSFLDIYRMMDRDDLKFQEYLRDTYYIKSKYDLKKITLNSKFLEAIFF